jgi:hypothetical protein
MTPSHAFLRKAPYRPTVIIFIHAPAKAVLTRDPPWPGGAPEGKDQATRKGRAIPPVLTGYGLGGGRLTHGLADDALSFPGRGNLVHHGMGHVRTTRSNRDYYRYDCCYVWSTTVITVPQVAATISRNGIAEPLCSISSSFEHQPKKQPPTTTTTILLLLYAEYDDAREPIVMDDSMFQTLTASQLAPSHETQHDESAINVRVDEQPRRGRR